VGEAAPETVARVLQAVEDGNPDAAEELLPLVYGELRRLGRSMMVKVPPGNTLQPTALVHEAYFRLVGRGDPGWNGRGHFFAAAAEAMRRILVEQARRKGRHKHGGGRRRVDVDQVDLPVALPTDDVLALNDALVRLREYDPRKADVVMLRYFAGLTIPEVARMLGVSEPTVQRDWRFARALLYDQIASPTRGG